MKDLLYSEDFHPVGRYAHVITGDGRTERRILRSMCKRFDGKSLTLFFPSPPKSGGTGLSNLLRGIKVIMTGRQPLHMLAVMDREFMGLGTLRTACSEHGITIQSIEETGPFIEANFVSGGLAAHVYIAISGTRKNIEEEISSLILAERGDAVNPAKDEIRDYLNRNGLTFESLIEGADIESLENAFVGLSQALRRIEEGLEHSSSQQETHSERQRNAREI